MENNDTSDFYFIGNNLALDFINSATAEVNAESLAIWAAGAGLIPQDKIDDLSNASGNGEVDRALRFREHLREMVEKLASGREISDPEIETVNKALSRVGRSVELKRGPDGFVKKLDIKVCSAEDLLGPIAESFVDLLCFGNPDHLRKCERPDCILYFYDTTKNHRRRWCSMAVCGNRAKASKYYRKKKEGIAA